MKLKTDTVLGMLREIEAKANNRVAANNLLSVVREVKQVVEARRTLGEDPDLSKLPELYAKVEHAVYGFNQAKSITMPALAEVVALIDEADSVEA